jgi:simple sugar transport system substrate-binding protein
MVQMASLIDAAVNQKPDGLVVTLPDVDALGPSLLRAAAAGIPVIVVNSGEGAARKLGALLYIGQDEALAGREAGERLKALGGKKGICVNVEPGNVTLDIRCKGFADGFGGPVKVVPTSLDPADVQAKVRAALQADPDVDTVLTTSALIAGEPALKAIAQSGLTGKVRLATFDLSPGMLKAVSDGEAAFCIDQQEYLYGYLPIVLLRLFHDTGTIPVNDILTGPRFITKDLAARVIELSAKGIR